MTSIESLVEGKWLLYFLTAWTKIAIILIPIFVGADLKFVIFDKGPFMVKLAVCRRMSAFCIFFFKNVFFYVNRAKIEGLIDLWDSFFKEEFYSDSRQEKLRNRLRRNKVILIISVCLNLFASLIFTVPTFFSPTKTLNHPSGFPYRRQSPDYEFLVVSDFFRIVMGCTSAGALDSILTVFLSYILLELTHLRDTLVEVVDEISVDDEGRMIYKSRQERFKSGLGLERREILFQVTQEPLLPVIPWGEAFEPREDRIQYEESVRAFELKINIWLLHHQQLIRFFEGVRDLFTPVASVQLIHVVFYTCFTAFHLVRAKQGAEAFAIPFVAASNVASFFYWCYFGYQIEYTSSQIFGDAFGRCWFLFPRRVQTAFSFIVLRGWKPLILRGISLFSLNLATFFQVFKVTYQMFAFLMQVAHEE